MTHQKKLLVLPLRCSSGYRGSLASYFPVGPTLNDNSLFFSYSGFGNITL